MPIEARIFIQGAATYVPHKDKEEVLVLMPDQDRAVAALGRGYERLCRHYSVVQMSSRYLYPTTPELWTTLDISRHWVRFRSDTRVSPSLKNGLSGAADLEKVLVAEGLQYETALDPKIVTDPLGDGRLHAGAVIDSGILSRASDYEGKFEFFSPRRRTAGPVQELSNTLKLELGPIDELTLLLRPFGSDAEPEEIPLVLPDDVDEMEVWIRYFCDLSRPGTPRPPEDPDEEDILDDPDFVLNYALLPDLEALVDKAEKGGLPYPRFARSWAGGNPIGIEPRKCTPSQLKASSYETPI